MQYTENAFSGSLAASAHAGGHVITAVLFVGVTVHHWPQLYAVQGPGESI